MRRCLVTCIVLVASLATMTAQNETLRIVVIEGEGAVNVVRSKTAVAPVVEIRDRGNLPLPGAVVTFSLEGSKTAIFATSSQAVTLTTNAAGRTTVPVLTPLAAGPVEIRVSASFEGQTATAVISQTNVTSTADAKAAGAVPPSRSGGSRSVAKIAGLAGGAAAAGAVALAASGDAEPPPAALSISLNPTEVIGIRDVTAFSFSAIGGVNNNHAYGWDFGDGFTASGQTVTRTFTGEGTYTVTLRAIGARVGGGTTEMANTSVRVGSLTGTWVQRVGNATFRLVITQQGRTLSGRWIVEGDPGAASNNSPLTGTISGQRNLTISQGGECARTMTMNINADLSALTGTVASSLCEGANNGAATFTRQ